MAMTRNLPRRQSGFTLVEVAIALVVLIAMTAVGVTIFQDSTRREESASTGNWLRVVANAAKTYEKNNAGTLQAAAGPTTPAIASAAQLVSLLPPGFNTTGPQGHTFTVRWIEPTAGKLQGMVFLQSGDDLTGMSLLQVAGQAGGGAGYVDPQNTAQGKSPRGTWTVALSNWGGTPGAGKPLYALFYDSEADSSTNDYLNRTPIAGKPEVNRMSTAIDMAGNHVNTAGTVSAVNLDASNGVTANAIAIGKSTFGATPYPYETIQLQAGLNMRMAIGTREHTVFANDGRLLVHGGVAAEGDVTSTSSVSANGNVTANGSLSGTEVYATNWFRTRGQGGWYSEAYGGGWHMTDPTWIRAYNNKNVYTAGEMRAGALTSDGNANVAGSIAIGGRSTSNDILVNRIVGEGAGCSETGVTARSSSGKLLTCASGVWSGGAGALNTIVVRGNLSACRAGSYANCPAGTVIVGGGVGFGASCGCAESNRFIVSNMPNGNGWYGQAECGTNYAFAVCASQ